MAVETQFYFRPLMKALFGGYAALEGVPRDKLRQALEKHGFARALYRLPLDERISAGDVLDACRPIMEELAGREEENWLGYIYEFISNALFKNSDFPEPSAGERQAVAFFKTVYSFLLGMECAGKEFDPLTDIAELTAEEKAESATAAEYEKLLLEARKAGFVELMRIGRETKPFDPASHTIGVHNVALYAARAARRAGLPVDLALVSGAALAHDIGKFGCRGKDAKRIPYLHYYYTWQWLNDSGLKAIAHVSANHSTWDLEFENLPIESLLLIYADFRVRGMRDENGLEKVRIYSLREAHEVIFGKLADMTEEKARHYRSVYAKLRDFEAFLISRGFSPELVEPPAINAITAADPALLTSEEATDSLKNLIFDNNVRLMSMLGGSESFSELLEQAGGEKSLHRIRTYLLLFEEYSTYMARESKLRLLSFLYELLMHREGDVRRTAGRIMGQLLANSGPKYRKELPGGAPETAMAPAMMDILQQSTELWAEYTEAIIHPDHKISPKHAQRISNSLKTVAASLFASCDEKEGRHYCQE